MDIFTKCQDPYHQDHQRSNSKRHASHQKHQSSNQDNQINH